MNLYPAIDLLDGRCVRLHQGKFDAATVYSDDPVAMAGSFRAAGATHLHVVDLAGSRDGTTPHAALIQAIAASSGLRVQVGGGIRSVAAARAYLDAGVERLVVGSLAVREPATVQRMAAEFGAERLVLALDVRPSGDQAEDGTPAFALAVQGWTETVAMKPWQLLAWSLEQGIKRVLCTDISRDGVLGGPSLALYAWLMDRYPQLELMASGGVGSLDDLRQLRGLGVPAAIVGKALYAGQFTLKEALACCANA